MNQHIDAALAHISNALEDLTSSPDQRPVPLLTEAMEHLRMVEAWTWKPIDATAKDGHLVLLALDNRGDLHDDLEHCIDDTEGFPRTIGSFQDDPDHPDGGVWQFAGWCWCHDHFTEGKGVPVLYAELPRIPSARDLPGGGK